MKQKFILLIIPLLILLNAGTGMAETTDEVDNQTSNVQKAAVVLAGEQINWYVISAGGNNASSANYSLNGTAGQTAVGTSNSPGYDISHGFFQAIGGNGPITCLLRGDVADPKDGNVLVNDIVWLVNYLFKAGPAPSLPDEGDCAVPLDGNTLVNDIVWLVNYLFKAGPAPPPC